MELTPAVPRQGNCGDCPAASPSFQIGLLLDNEVPHHDPGRRLSHGSVRSGHSADLWHRWNIFQKQFWSTIFSGDSVTQPVGGSIGLASTDHLDRLTGVAHRDYFYDRLEQLSQKPDGQYMLLVKINIRRFHHINTSFGYDIGDELLIAVAHRLSELSGGVVGRLSGDEFAIAHRSPSLGAAGSTVSRVQTLLEPNFVLPGATLVVRFSIGYAIQQSGESKISLLRNAGIALHEAKISGQRRPCEFDCDVAAIIENRGRLTADLQHALENGEFVLYYQPKVELMTGAIIGAEALLRWNNPICGLQPPGRLISVAEESFLITEIGTWALRNTAAFAVEVNGRRAHPLEFSVNVSQLQFRDHDFPSIVKTVLQDTGAEASWLKLELTESLLADHSSAMVAMLHELREVGVGLAIDDFGTGYSSLNYLQSFPISEIKIDKCFISEVDSERSKHIIVDAMVRLGMELQISVVAEGAETEEEIEALRTLGCPYVQGHFFGEAMPETEFLALVGEQSKEPNVSHNLASVVTPDGPQTAILVEDDPLVREGLSCQLNELGWTVVEAPDAETALSLPESLVPKILVTDVDLGPGLNGFELCSLARYRWPAVGIIVMSGRPPSDAQMNSLRAEEIFLQKPIRSQVLETAVARVVNSVEIPFLNVSAASPSNAGIGSISVPSAGRM